MRQVINKKDEVYEGHQNHKRWEYDKNTCLKLKETYITLNKTSTIMMMSSDLISQCIVLQGMYIKNQNKKIEEILLQQEIEKTFPQLNELEQAEFSILLAFLLEQSNIIIESLDFVPGGTHKQKTYRLSKKVIDMFFNIHAYDLVIPMVCKPRDWQQTESTGMNFGGFIMNETGAYPGVHLRSKKSTTFVDKITIDTVNHLQSQAFEVNSKELDEIMKNETPYLRNFLEMSVIHWRECFFLDEEKNLTMYTEKQYIDLHTKEYKNQLENKELSDVERNSIQSKMLKTAEKYSNKYRTTMSCIIKFIYMIKLAVTLKGIKLYYPMYLCGRGRYYPIGFGIFPHGDSLAKLLLRLDIPIIEVPRTTDESLQLLKFLEKSEIKGKDFFDLKNLIQEDRNFVGVDVSNSGPQILCGIVGDINGLFDTNFCVLPKDQGSINKKDLYKIVLTKIEEYFKLGKPTEMLWTNLEDIDLNEINDDEIENLKNVNTKEINEKETEKEKKENLKKLESVIPQVMKLFDRTFLKEWVMQFVYSEGHHTRATYLAKKIEDLFNKNEKLKGAFTYRDYYTLGSVFSFCFVEAITEEYPDMCDFSSRLQEIFGKINIKNCSIKITSQRKGLWTRLYFSQQTSKAIYYISSKTNKKNKISLKIDTHKIDRRRVQRSIVANFIHNLDSEILKTVVLGFRLLNKPIWVIHDNFLVSPDDIELVKLLYFKSFIACIFQDDPLKNLLNANIDCCDTADKILEFVDEKYPENVVIGKRKKKTLQEFEKQRQDMYSKIKNQEVVQSFRILS